MPKHIIADIDENGEVSIEVKGARGDECDVLTEDLEKALGKTVDKKRKREYYQQTVSREQESRM
jgi:hypothetical protein